MIASGMSNEEPGASAAVPRKPPARARSWTRLGAARKALLSMPTRATDALVVACLAVAILVLAGPKLWSPQLYAEDALILYRDAYDHAAATIVRPYAGYLVTVGRLVAFPGLLLRDQFVPFFYVMAAMAALLLTSWIVFRRLSGLGVLLGLVAAAVILFSPSRYEVQFSVSNSQWILAAALLVVLADPAPLKSPVLAFIGVLLAGLTGPFAILFLPVLLARHLLMRDLSRSVAVYSATILAAAVQLLFLATSMRQKYGPDETADIGGFAEAILRDHPAHFIGPAINGALSVAWVWTTLALVLAVLWRHRRERNAVFAVLILVGGAMVYISSLFVFKFAPTKISPNAVVYSIPLGGERYFYIPTVAFLIATLLAAGLARRSVRVYLVGSVIAVLVVGLPFLWRYPYADLQWPAYAALARVEHGVKAPIYHNLVLDSIGPRQARPVRLSLLQLPMQLASLEINGQTWVATTDDPGATFEVPELCRTHPYVTFALEGTGFAFPQVFLSKGAQRFTERESLTIKNQDLGTIYFAFKKRKDESYRMRFDIDGRAGTFVVRRAEIICY
jgi:hypothetical protein